MSTPKSKPSRRQCAKCPWRFDVDPNDIPNGYCATKHAALRDTITEGFGPLRIMACHETPIGHEVPCVGWLVNQLGPGNNLSLRMRVSAGQIDGNVRTMLIRFTHHRGQHE